MLAMKNRAATHRYEAFCLGSSSEDEEDCSGESEGISSSEEDYEEEESLFEGAPTKSQYICAFTSVLLVALVLNAGTVILTSFITDIGLQFYDFLAKPIQLGDYNLGHTAFFAITGCSLLLAYLFDLWMWTGPCRIFFFLVSMTALLFFLAGILFMTDKVPSIPLIYGCVLVAVAIHFLRDRAYKRIPKVVYRQAESLAIFIVTLLLFCVWFAWLAIPQGFLGLNGAWDTWIVDIFSDRDPILDKRTAFIAWCSPAILGGLHLVAALLVWIRSRFEGRSHMVESDERAILIDIKIFIVIIAFLCFCLYVAASVAAYSTGIEKTVLVFAGVSLVAIVLYLRAWLGTERLGEVARSTGAMDNAQAILSNDWVKAMIVLIGPPLPLVCIVLEFVHETIRKCLRCFRRLAVDDNRADRRFCCLTLEANYALEEGCRFLFSDLTSVLSKTMYIAIIIVLAMVSISTFLPILLAWVNGQLASQTLDICLGVVAVVVLVLFLFPPVSGQVIYGFATAVIQTKYGYADGFWKGISVSIALCLAGKLLSSAITQKAIGVPFKSSVAVKKFIGVQSRFMKAMRSILSQRGCNFAKSCMLTFGPDWPISVLTGILDIPVFPMLLGTLPVVIVITPMCISSAYLMRAYQDPEEGGRWSSIASINLLLTALASAAGNCLITYFVQAVLEDHKEELDAEHSDWMRDPLEAQVLDSIEKDKVISERWAARTSWSVAPNCIRACLVLGSLLSTITVYILVQPVSTPFVKFTVTDEISDLPGGTPLGAVKQLGWVVMGLCGVIMMLTAVFQSWGKCVTSRS